MIQHMLLVVVAPPLWLLGTPGWLLAPIFRRAPVRRITRIITNPIVAFLLLNVTLYIWHLPPLYDAALTNEALHIVEHLMYITLGVLFWWVVLSPVEEAPRVSRGVAIIYLFLACQPMVLLERCSPSRPPRSICPTSPRRGSQVSTRSPISSLAG